MNANHHVTKPVMIGEIRDNGQFQIVHRSEPIAPVPWSPYLPANQPPFSLTSATCISMKS